MEKFKTIEEAQAAYDNLKKSYDDLNAEHSTATNVVNELKAKLEETTAGKPAKVYAVVGKQKYVVNFGVRGKSKQEVAEDQKLLAELIKIGSGAVTAVK